MANPKILYYCFLLLKLYGYLFLVYILFYYFSYAYLQVLKEIEDFKNRQKTEKNEKIISTLKGILLILFFPFYILFFQLIRYFVLDLKWTINYLKNSFISFYIFLVLNCGFIIFAIWDSKTLVGEEDKKNILIEFHGLFFDFIVLGIIFSIFSYYKEKRDKQDSLKRQIWCYEDIKNLSQKEKNDLSINIRTLIETGINILEIKNTNFECSKFNFHDNQSFKIKNCQLIDFHKHKILRNSTFVKTIFIDSTLSQNLKNIDLISCLFISQHNQTAFFKLTNSTLNFNNVNLDFTIFNKIDCNSINQIFKNRYNLLGLDKLPKKLLNNDFIPYVEKNLNFYVMAIPNDFIMNDSSNFYHIVNYVYKKHNYIEHFY